MSRAGEGGRKGSVAAELPEPLEWSMVISEQQQGQRLDRVLTAMIPSLGRKGAARLCERNAVLVDGRPRPKSFLLAIGQTVIATLPHWGVALAAPDLPLSVILETPFVVVVDKAAGVPCSALVDKESNTLAGALIARYPEMQTVGYGPREPGLLHRIDNQTSGLVVAARSSHAFDSLKESMARGVWKKKYLALTTPGALSESGTVETFLAPNERDSRRVRVAESGYRGRTQFWVRQRGAQADVVELLVHSAYRHQIRCHLAHLGAPLIGDILYGSQDHRLAPRHALHASYVAAEASEVPAFEASSSLPKDLLTLL